MTPQPKRYEVFDLLVPGLAIRVTPAGHKSFTLYYRHHGRLRRVGLGRYPDVLLADARTAATQQRGRIFNGADPAEEKEAERATHGDTVGALFESRGRLTRVKADGLVGELLARVRAVNHDPKYAFKVHSVALFGSYLSNRDRIGDVDVAIALRPRL